MTPAVATVVIPVFNGLHVTRPCFESVVRWTDLDHHRVLLVNDGSDHHTTETLRSWALVSPSISLMENGRNIGFVKSCNRAFEAAESEFVVVLNSDTCVTPRWLVKLVDCMRHDPSIALASPLTNFGEPLAIPVSPGLDYVAMNALLEDIWDGSYPDIPTINGFCMMVRASVLNTIGAFDLVFRTGYGEESDLSMRANYFGYRTVCSPNTYVYHRGRGTFGQSRRNRENIPNKKIFQDRWKPLYLQRLGDFTEQNPLGNLILRVALHVPELTSAIRR